MGRQRPRLVAAGGDPSGVTSVASFFVSRVDAEADRHLAGLDASEVLRGWLGIANAKLAYRSLRRTFSGERWEALAARGASSQRCLWASTSNNDPARRDVRYVEDLIGPETITTIPEATVRAFQDHGWVGPPPERDVDGAELLLERLATTGLDYGAVSTNVEREGIETFAASFRLLLDRIREQRERCLVGRGAPRAR